jgi:hypothetical protein
MPETISVELIYRGPEVEDGTMPVEYMLNALAGFSGAFIKLARHEDVRLPEHGIRVAALQKGSAKILIDVVDWVAKNPVAAGVIATAASGAAAGTYKVVKNIIGVLKGKKALQGQGININNSTFIDNRVFVNEVQLTPRQLDVLRSGELDEDLARLTAPLRNGSDVEMFELRSVGEVVQVSAKERPFVVGQVEGRREVPPKARPLFDTTAEDNVWLEGALKSHSKRNNRGTFETAEGESMKYQYVGKDPQSLLRGYASGGTVRVFGMVEYDEQHQPVSIKIREVQPSTKT